MSGTAPPSPSPKSPPSQEMGTILAYLAPLATVIHKAQAQIPFEDTARTETAAGALQHLLGLRCALSSLCDAADTHIDVTPLEQQAALASAPPKKQRKKRTAKAAAADDEAKGESVKRKGPPVKDKKRWTTFEDGFCCTSCKATETPVVRKKDGEQVCNRCYLRWRAEVKKQKTAAAAATQGGDDAASTKRKRKAPSKAKKPATTTTTKAVTQPKRRRRTKSRLPEPVEQEEEMDTDGDAIPEDDDEEEEDQ